MLADIARTVGLAYDRSYRDAASKEAVRQRGIGSARDPVYTDLTFSPPGPRPDFMLQLVIY